MENILLVLNIILALILVLLVLMQKSEGGALGIGVSQENMMFSKYEKRLKHTQGIVFDHFCICKYYFAFILIFLTPDVDHARPKVALGQGQTNRYQRIASKFEIYTL